MKKIDDEIKRQLIKIARMYYFDDMTQQTIADTMNMSRSKVSRSLTLAKELGIVKIFIDDEFSEEQILERAICAKYGIREARVVSGEDKSLDEVAKEMGSAVTMLLDNLLKDNDILGLMAGYTINAISENMGTIYRKNLKIVPLVGGMGVTGSPWQVNKATTLLSEKFKATFYVMNCPTNVSSAEARDILVKEPEIKAVLDLTKKCSVALVGIGEISDSATLVSIGSIKKKDANELIKQKARASMGTGFFDANGNEVDTSLTKRMIGVSTADLKKIPNVIAVAAGIKKAEAIEAALKSKIVDVLVTDSETAKAIIE